MTAPQTFPILTSARLRLEPCDDCHFEGLHTLNADPEVMRYITGQPETREQTAAVIARVKARWARFGYSWWSFIELTTGELIGIGCIQNLRRSGTDPDPACPMEIGWRLRRDRWHRGLATESAIVMARFAFDTLRAPELYAVCDPENYASSAVMERLGMRRRGLEHWYEKELLAYAITQQEFAARHS
jgi:RimJ/RimL family protein N-acetyltransferase